MLPQQHKQLHADRQRFFFSPHFPFDVRLCVRGLILPTAVPVFTMGEACLFLIYLLLITHEACMFLIYLLLITHADAAPAAQAAARAAATLLLLPAGSFPCALVCVRVGAPNSSACDDRGESNFGEC